MSKEPDMRVISLGAGIQSTAMVLMAIRGDLDPIDMVVFGDTGNEPSYVYENVERLRKKCEENGVIFDVVVGGNIAEDVFEDSGRYVSVPFHIKTKNGKKSIAKRQCTYEYKVKPVGLRIRQELLKRGLAYVDRAGKIMVTRGTLVELWLGISLDEATRMRSHKNDPKWKRKRYPLIEKRMTRRQCKDVLVEEGFTDVGRSSCIICPYHNMTFFRELKERNEEDFNRAVEYDKRLRKENVHSTQSAGGKFYVSRYLIPLDTAFKKHGHRIGFNEEMCDDGYCWS